MIDGVQVRIFGQTDGTYQVDIEYRSGTEQYDFPGDYESLREDVKKRIRERGKK
jgi:hypothetical protein